MKKKNLFVAVAVSVLAVSSLAACGATGGDSTSEVTDSPFKGQTLEFFNWGEYIDNTQETNVITPFEKKYGCKINLSTFDTNESMLTKLETTAYDVLVPSDYAVEQLAVQNKLQSLDYSKFKTYSKDKLVPSLKEDLENLAKDVNNVKGFDLMNYAVPYTWGMVGLIYDSSVISDDEIKRDGWNALKQAKNADGSQRKVCLYDASRDVYSVALAANGLDFVNPNDDQISTATTWLKEVVNSGAKVSFSTEEILDDMPNHKYDICLDYSGDAAYSITNEVDPKSPLKYYVPDAQPGANVRTNIYTDALCITSTCKNVDLAYAWIDYLCQNDVAAKNTEYIGYTTPLNEVYEAETGEGGYFASIGDAYKITATDGDHFYRYNAELKAKLDALWTSQIHVL
jgi:spermidine/putrescine-binding protein